MHICVLLESQSSRQYLDSSSCFCLLVKHKARLAQFSAQLACVEGLPLVGASNVRYNAIEFRFDHLVGSRIGKHLLSKNNSQRQAPQDFALKYEASVLKQQGGTGELVRTCSSSTACDVIGLPK